MLYSCISFLALVLNIIINHRVYKYSLIRGRHKDPKKQSIVRYSYFLVAANTFFAADIVWGILYAHHDDPSLFPVLYLDCVLYFVFMFLTMLTWMRYVAVYLKRRGHRSTVLLYAVWSMFTLGLVYLAINRFFPFIFSFNSAHEYIAEPGRYIAFIIQILLYLITSAYLFAISRKMNRNEKKRYIAMGIICITMEVFLVFQLLDSGFPFYAMGLMVGICLFHIFVEEDEKREKEIIDHIASGLAEDYEAMFYINIETGEYREYSASEEYNTMNVPTACKDFYAETRGNVTRYVHPDDREFAESLYYKEVMLKNLEGRKSFSYKYRVMVKGDPRYFRFIVRIANDGRHFVLCVKDIDDEVTAENIRLENQKKHITFSYIAESLASNYDVIYYVDVASGEYISYECNNIYGQLEAKRSGPDFYSQTREDISNIVHKADREMVLEFTDRDNMISSLENSKTHSLDYRISVNGKTHYIRMTVRKTSDGLHFIVGLENIDAEVKKEKQQLKALNAEKELARRDELTGVKNKTAYKELEESVQANIDNGMDYLPFALLVCDTNNLKKINDTNGHAAGDEYIKESAKLLCETFTHSPVFRVGGDEFVVFLRGNDYSSRIGLVEYVKGKVQENKGTGEGPVFAVGMAEYDPQNDSLVSEVFDRADREMYENKQKLKEQ